MVHPAQVELTVADRDVPVTTALELVEATELLVPTAGEPVEEAEEVPVETTEPLVPTAGEPVEEAEEDQNVAEITGAEVRPSLMRTRESTVNEERHRTDYR